MYMYKDSNHLAPIVYLFENKVQQVSVHLHLKIVIICLRVLAHVYSAARESKYNENNFHKSCNVAHMYMLSFAKEISQLFESIHDNTFTVKGESEGTWTSDLVTTVKSCM